MPYFRRYRYRRPYYRRKFSKYSRRKWSRKRPIGSGMNGKRFFKLKHQEQMVSSGTGIYSGYFNNSPTTYLDFSHVAELFDVYKVAALKVKFVPSRPNDESTTVTYRPIYIAGDPDTSAAFTSVDQPIQYENMKVYDLSRPWKYYYKIPTRTQVTGSTILLKGGYIDTQYTTPSASIRMWAEGLSLSENYGTFIVTAYVVAKQRN